MKATKKHMSYWQQSTPSTDYPELNDNISSDVVIVGAGMAGLLTAYLLTKSGKKVTVIEMNKIASDVSANTTAKITILHGIIYQNISAYYGKDVAKVYLDSNARGFSEIARIIKEEQIECDYQTMPSYIYASHKENAKTIETEAKILISLGIKCEILDKTEISDSVKALKVNNQAIFHPRKFMLKLAEIISDLGCKIYENTTATDIHDHIKPVKVLCNHGAINAGSVVITTNFPFYDKKHFYTKLFPYKSYAALIDNINLKGMYYCIDNDDDSFRPVLINGKNHAIIGVGTHRAGQADPESYYNNLKRLMLITFKNSALIKSWSTQDNSTPDKIPLVGSISEDKNIFMATGFGGWGMTNSAMSALLLSHLINVGHSSWEECYKPTRRIKQKTIFLKENLNSVKELFKIGSKKPKCTHLGCRLNYFKEEETWDCPCHGSRFSKNGEVLHGPASTPIKKIKQFIDK